jgi:hypothetical protein
MVVQPDLRLRRRRIRSMIVVSALLVASPGLLAMGRRVLMPLAVRAGLADGMIERELAAALGVPVHLRGATLLGPDLLELRGLHVEPGAAGFAAIDVEAVRVVFDGAVPSGRPVLIELVEPRARFDPELLRRAEGGGASFRLPPEVLARLRRMPELRLAGGRISVGSGPVTDELTALEGRYVPGVGTLELTGDFGGAGPGSFRVSGAIDPTLGTPTLSITSRRPTLPGTLEELISRLVGAPVRSLGQHEVNLRAGRLQAMKLDLEAGQLALPPTQSGPFRAEIRYGADGLALAGSIPMVETILGEGAYRLVVFGSFDLDQERDDVLSGRAQLVMRLYAGQEEELLEQADLVLEQLRILGDESFEASGTIDLLEDRRVELEFRQRSEAGAELVLRAQGWDLSRRWTLPWAVAGVEPIPMAGTADVRLGAELAADRLALSADVGGVGLRMGEGGDFSRLALRAVLRRAEAAGVGLDGTLALEGMGRRGLALEASFSARRQEALRGTAEAVVRAGDELARLSLEEFVWDGSLSGRGWARLASGDRIELTRLGWDAGPVVEWSAAGLDLSGVDPRLWDLLGAAGLTARGVVEARGLLTPGRVALIGAARGTAQVSWNAMTLRFARGTYESAFTEAPRRHRLTLQEADVGWEDWEVETPELEAELEWDEAGPVCGSLTLGGGRFLRGARLLDVGSRRVSLSGRGSWSEAAGRWEGVACLEIQDWGHLEAQGRVEPAAGKGFHALEWDARDISLEQAQQALALWVDWKGVAVRGRADAHVHTWLDAAGFSLAGELSGARIERLDWGAWQLRDVTLALPLELGVKRPLSHEHPAGGMLAIGRAVYPGGEALGVRAELSVVRGLSEWKISTPSVLEGSFLGGRVQARELTLSLREDGAVEAVLAARLDSMSRDRFSDWVGIRSLGGEGSIGGGFGRVRIRPERIDFEEGGLTDEHLFMGVWRTEKLWIEDPFGPDTSYQARLRFTDINLRQLTSYLMESKLTPNGLMHGCASGSLEFKTLHDGGLESFELYLRTLGGDRHADPHGRGGPPDKHARQFVERPAAQTLARSLGPKGRELADEMEALPQKTSYYGMAIYATMGLDRKVKLRGGYYKPKPWEPAVLYTPEEVKAGVRKGDGYFFIGSSLFKVDIAEAMAPEAVDWDELRGKMAGGP